MTSADVMNLARRIAALEKRLRASETSNRLERASVLVAGTEVDVPAALLAAQVGLPGDVYALDVRLAVLENTQPAVTPHVRRYRNGSQAVPDGSTAIVNWGAGDGGEQRGGITYDNAGTFTVPLGGIYHIDSSALLSSAGTSGHFHIRVLVNGSTVAGNEFWGRSHTESLWVSITVPMVAGDDVQIQVENTSGVNGSVGASTSAQNYVSIAYLGP